MNSETEKNTNAQPENDLPETAPARDLEAELAQAKDQMLRALADAENTRKRALKDRDDASRYAIANFARELLDVADNLRRALDAIPQEEAADPHIAALVEGVRATERGLLGIFERQHIRKIDPMDEIFNPNYHEVMVEIPGTGKKPGTVTLVMEPGYVLHDRLLRPARVGVAKDEGQGGGNGSAPGGTIDTQA